MDPQNSPITFARLGARAILDSRGFPTVEVKAALTDGVWFVASAPAGASTGTNEATELRDGGPAFSGRGVTAAIAGIEREIAPLILCRSWTNIAELDQALAELDGTLGYRRLGANAVVAVSMLAARAFAHSAGQTLHRWIAGQSGSQERLPVPHFNLLNGGAHAANSMAFQEFMVAPVCAPDEKAAVRMGAEIHHALRGLVSKRFGCTGLGDEGGFVPHLEDPRSALDLLVQAIDEAGYEPGRQRVAIALDPAANSFYLGDGRYLVNGRKLDREQLTTYYLDLLDAYPIRSLEDGFAEDDIAGWTTMSQAVGGSIQLVGDDLYVSDPARIRRGHDLRLSNSALIKPNQIGTVSGTLEAIRTARESGMTCMISHRSGETADTFIADLAVGTGVGQIKAGAPARGERVAKYNRLTEIEADHPDIAYGLA